MDVLTAVALVFGAFFLIAMETRKIYCFLGEAVALVFGAFFLIVGASLVLSTAKQAVALVFGAFFLIAMLIGFASLAFTLWMLIDCVQRDFKDKLLWVIVILVGGPIGALAYYFAVRKKLAGKKTASPNRRKPKR